MSNKYVQTNTFYQAGAGNIIGATSVVLTSFTDIYGNVLTMTDFGDLGYITLEPDTTNEESATFTGVTANVNGTYSLTGVKTSLAKDPYTQTSGLVRQHSGGTKVVVSDTATFWSRFTNKDNDETIVGQWTFSTFPITPSNSDASTTVKGVTKLSVAPASASNPIAVGTNDDRVPVGYAVDSVGTDAYAISPTPAETAYVAGKEYTFKAGTANTGSATLNVSGLGAKTIKKNVSTDLSTGDILLNQIIVCKYDGTNMQMVSMPASIPTLPIDLTSQVTGVLPKTNGGTGTASNTKTSGILSASGSATDVIAHGLGVIPVKVKITCLSGGTTKGQVQSFGTYITSGGTYACVYNWYNNGGTGSVDVATDTSVVVYILVSGGGTNASATVAVDATNITLTWSGSSYTGLKIMWEAEAI